MKKTVLLCVLLCAVLFTSSQLKLDLKGNTTPTWQETIDAFGSLDSASAEAQLIEVGKTDVGKPLHLFVINRSGLFYPELFEANKTVVFINNAIHPGEPDGVNASLLLAEELLQPKSALNGVLDSIIVCIVPIYNVDGALMRNSYTRANQDGPYEYGFRGNARNLDLNRDFIKCDSKNALSFNRLFTAMDPDVFIDTHVSNGADYPYVMTLISTQADKLGPLGAYLRNTMEPALFAAMEKNGEPMCHYVNTMGRTPESGIVSFLETPRFASGYAALFNTLSFITETHMLKPFPQRVEATRLFLRELLLFAAAHNTEIITERKKADQQLLQQREFALRFELDTLQRDTLSFQAYRAHYEESKIGTGQRLKYERDSTYLARIAFYDHYRDTLKIKAPGSYIVPQAWGEVIDRLKANGVLMYPLSRDTVLEVETYFIDAFETERRPYEGHYVHHQVKVRSEQHRLLFFKGDYLIPTQQRARRYIIETLEPQGEDSFFAWGFFESILQRKEYFSDYVFEEKAEEILNENPQLKAEFEATLAIDPALRANHWDQLYWIYSRSIYAEKSVNRYPIFRQ
ncbi:MAG: M14 family zinc carboxypeptidase [Flavobacteriales bacterium]